MLALVEQVEGVGHAEIDYSGVLLRLTIRDEVALANTAAVLKGLGYESERASEADVREVTSWYDRGSVGDLSRIEASAIADRIVPTFARTQRLSSDRAHRVRRAVVDALYSCFISRPLASGPSTPTFGLSCERAVEESVWPIVGRALANALAELVRADLSEDHRR